MIGDLEPYPEYKESGSPWLGQVPAHWAVRRLSASITDCVNGVWGADPNGRDDLVCIRVADFDRNRLRVSLRKKTIRAIPLSARPRRLLRNGDLLLEKSGGGDLQPVGAVVAYDHDVPAVCSNFVARMPIAAGYDYSFVNYLHFTLYAHQVNIRSIKQTTGIQNLDGRSYLSEPVAFPPLAEQIAIVRFLDYASGRLERAILAKRKLIALLKEQKQSIIYRAVTLGIDTFGPVKPCGILGLGFIPVDWETKPIKRVASVQNGFAFPSESYADTGVPLIRIGDVRSDGTVNIEHSARLPENYLSSYSFVRIHKGDLVMAMTGATIGKVSIYLHDSPALLNQRVCAFRCRSGVVKQDYLFLLLSSRLYLQQVLVGCYGGAQPNISDTNLADFKMPIATLEVQDRIVSVVETETKSLNTAISRLEREMELLREYRTRLISDVVTGQLDVRDLDLPDVEEEPVPPAAEPEHLDEMPDEELEEAVP